MLFILVLFTIMSSHGSAAYATSQAQDPTTRRIIEKLKQLQAGIHEHSSSDAAAQGLLMLAIKG